MNNELLNEDALNEFRKLVQNSENMNRELDCYLQLMKEMLVRTYSLN